MDREETVGHIIAKELGVHVPDLLELMRQAGNSDKVERAASLTDKKRKSSGGVKDDLTSLFEMSATPDPKKTKPAASPGRAPSSVVSS